MRITESRLRRVIRSVIAESLGHESLKGEMLRIIDDLRETLQGCRSARDCAAEINLATRQMSDAWNMEGGRYSDGPFVKKCSVGLLMDEMQIAALEGRITDFQSSLDQVEDEIKACTFDELNGYSGTDRVRQHISDTVNNPGAMGPNESVLRRAIRKELNRR